MRRRDRDVRGVNRRLAGHRGRLEEAPRERTRRLSCRKHGNALDRGKATGRSPGITARNLFKHGFRDKQVESIPPRPPFTSDFLMSG